MNTTINITKQVYKSTEIGNILQFLYSLKNQPGNNTEAMQCPEKGYKAFSSLHQITLMLPLIATAKHTKYKANVKHR